MLRAYNTALQKYPIITKCLTGGVLFSLGDAVTQKLIEQKSEFDYKRNRNLFILGSTYIAPALHVWYCKILPKIASIVFANSSKTVRVFGSMAMDQMIFAPILLSGFLTYVGFISDPTKQGIEKGMQIARTKIWQTMLANWKIWPLATTINFWFMPLKYQVLFANIVGFFWNIILSYIAYK